MKLKSRLTPHSALSSLCLTLLFGFGPLGSFSCVGGHGQDSSSQALNDDEELAYKRAMLRCHKTGGSRVVKIEGNLRCF